MKGNLICGCVVDGDAIPCVFDDPEYTVTDCDYAKRLHEAGKGRDGCQYWKPLADEEHATSHLTAEVAQLTAERERLIAGVERLTAMHEKLKSEHKVCVEQLALAYGNLDDTETERDKYKTALESIENESGSSGGDMWKIHGIASDALASVKRR